MNDAILTELKILVERAVRPVRVPPRRKLKMREELLAHVSAVFEEEAAKYGANDAALDRTRQRFGDPAELTASLQESVPSLERYVGHLQHYLCRRPGESTARFALRHAVLAGFYFGGAAILGLVLVLGLFLVMPEGGNERWTAFAWLSLLPAAFFLSAGVAVLLGHGLWYSLCGPEGCSWRKMAILTLLSSGVGPLVLFAISIQTTEDLADAVRDTLPSLPPAVLIPPFVLVFGADLVRRTTAGPLGRGWLYTIAMDTGLAAVLALVMFALAMALTGNIELALEQSRVMACIVLTWLVPLDLVVTAPSVVQRLRSDREWASLPIDAGKGAIA